MQRYEKTYVDVTAEMRKDGVCMPRQLYWEEDSTKYDITSVREIRGCAAPHVGGVGQRYTCVINGREKHLYLEELGEKLRWFVEKRIN